MKTVLFADDIPAFLDLFEVILQRADCRFLRASDGPAALRIAHESQPDLVYLDYDMPVINGVEVCRILKSEPAFARVPVILVSAHEGAAELATRCGADLFLSKPVDEPALLATLDTFLRLHPRKEKRAPADWPITFWREGSSHLGRIRDLSKTGFFLESGALQTIGARLAISFPFPREGNEELRTFVGEAIVVRRDEGPGAGMGCRFFRTTQAGLSSVETYLARNR